MPEFDETSGWKRIPLEIVDLDEERAGDWVVGIEFLREEGAERARVRGFAIDGEGEEYYYESPASSGDQERMSDEDLFQILPEEVAVVLENTARAAAVSNMLGMGREMEVLKPVSDPDLGESEEVFDIIGEEVEPEIQEPIFQAGVMDMREPLSKQGAKAEAREMMRGFDVDAWSQQLVVEDLQGEAEMLRVSGDKDGADALLTRLKDFQDKSAREVSERRDHGADEAPEGFRGKEQKRRDKGDDGKAAGNGRG